MRAQGPRDRGGSSAADPVKADDQSTGSPRGLKRGAESMDMPAAQPPGQMQMLSHHSGADVLTEASEPLVVSSTSEAVTAGSGDTALTPSDATLTCAASGESSSGCEAAGP